MTSTRVLLAAATTLLSSSLLAQTTTPAVIPAAYAAVESPGSSTFPFAPAAGRVQQILRGSEITTGAEFIKSLAYRRDLDRQFPFQAIKIANASIEIGNCSLNPEKMSNSFNANRTAQMTQVFSGTLDIPTTMPSSSPPAPFAIKFGWSSGVLFAGVSNNLLVDLRMPGKPSGNNAYWFDAAVHGGVVRTYGAPCSFKLPQAYEFSIDPGGLKTGGQFRAECGVFSAAMPGTLIIGASDTSYAGASLPLNLTAIGAPACFLHTSMDVLLPFNTRQSGFTHASTYSVGIPNNPAFANLQLYAQPYYIEKGANPLDLVSLEAIAFTTISGAAPAPANMLTSTDANAATGAFLDAQGPASVLTQIGF